MTSMSAPTTEPTITHPAWCKIDRCRVDGDGGVHWGVDAAHEFTSPGGSRFDALVALSRVVDHDEQPSALYLSFGGDGECSLDQLDTFARWLTARVSEYRQAVATEGGL
jgi:hypothetical protein